MDERVDEPAPPTSEEAQLRALLAAMEAVHQGDLSRRLPVHGTHPLMDRLAEAFNASVARTATLTQELARVLGAVAEGDLRQKVPLELGGEPVKGEFLHLATTVNALVDRLSALAAEVIRVTREVSTEEKRGGQADEQGVAGAWRELTHAVNALASSHTAHVRDMLKVASAVARGDLTEKLTADARGEALELKNTINTMVDQLAAFAAEVTRVSKQVGPEGKRGRPSGLQGLSGIWKDLNDNVSVTERLALAARYKREALANMTHELRTPLNSVLILSEVLAENKEGRLSPKEVEYAKTIHGSGTDLLHLITGILDMSKVDAGRMQLNLSPVPLSEVKEFFEHLFEYQAEKKGVGFAVRFSDDLPSRLYTDRQRLQQVLKNLLSNALKFTDSGRVELRVSRVESQRLRFGHEALRRASHVLAFSVVDSGIGIPKDKQARIFEPFLQADDSTSRKYGGTGLGLAISRSLADLMGGELHVDSEPGQGSTFTLYLPERSPPPDGGPSHGEDSAPERREGVPGQSAAALPPPPSPQEPEPMADAPQSRGQTDSAPAEPDTRLAGREVLVASEDARNLFALTTVLERGKLNVRISQSGKETLEILRAHPDMDAVVLDITEPEMNGYETLRAIRQDARLASLPVIALVFHAVEGGREKCLEAGANDSLTKPLELDEFFERLRLWCRTSQPPDTP